MTPNINTPAATLEQLAADMERAWETWWRWPLTPVEVYMTPEAMRLCADGLRALLKRESGR